MKQKTKTLTTLQPRRSNLKCNISPHACVGRRPLFGTASGSPHIRKVVPNLSDHVRQAGSQVGDLVFGNGDSRHLLLKLPCNVGVAPIHPPIDPRDSAFEAVIEVSSDGVPHCLFGGSMMVSGDGGRSGSAGHVLHQCHAALEVRHDAFQDSNLSLLMGLPAGDSIQIMVDGVTRRPDWGNERVCFIQ